MPDRKSIGTCWECGKPAFKRRKTKIKAEKNGKLAEREVTVELCYAHYSQYLRNQRKGRPSDEYTQPRKHKWDDAMYQKLLVMHRDACMSQSEIARALQLTQPQISQYLKKAAERFPEK